RQAPMMTWALIAINAAVFLYELSLGPGELEGLFYVFGVVPAPLHPSRVGTRGRIPQGKVTVFVPHYAMSGGTLIALAADEVVMSPHAVLGPVDPQRGQYPAASLLRVVARKPVVEVR